MVHYRSEIMASVLEAVDPQGTNKTRIKFKAFLSTEQTREYITELVEKDLLSYDEDNKTYHITYNGEKYLELYELMKKQLVGK
jgi:predicted transcriptional regulator